LQPDKWFGSRSTNFGGPPSPPFRRAILGSIAPRQLTAGNQVAGKGNEKSLAVLVFSKVVTVGFCPAAYGEQAPRAAGSAQVRPDGAFQLSGCP
jgi:hypothetical protein